MNKYASPKFIKLMQQGRLSTEAVQRIADAMPKNSFRGVRQLGSGVEGRAAEGVVGGQGVGVLKSFKPRSWLYRLIRRLQFPLNVFSPTRRAEIMQANPDIFPEIYGVNRRGILMELLGGELPRSAKLPGKSFPGGELAEVVSGFSGAAHKPRAAITTVGGKNYIASDFGVGVSGPRNMGMSKQRGPVVYDPQFTRIPNVLARLLQRLGA